MEPGALLPTLQRVSDHQAEEPTVPAADVLSVLTNPSSNTAERLQATLILAEALAPATGTAAEATPVPAELAALAVPADLPKAAAADVLHMLSDPTSAKACMSVVAAPPASAATSAAAGASDTAEQDVLVRQAAAWVLDRAAAAEPAVAAAVVHSAGCLTSLVKLVTAGSTANSTPPAVKVDVLQLLCTISRSTVTSGSTEGPAAQSQPATAARTAAGAAGAAPTAAAASAGVAGAANTRATAAQQLVQEHKLIPALVQCLGEVKVVKGKAAVSVAQRPRSAAGLKGKPESGSVAIAGAAITGPIAARQTGMSGAGTAPVTAARGRAYGRMAEAGSASAAGPAAAPVAPTTVAPVVPSGNAAVMLAAVKLLQVLAGAYGVSSAVVSPSETLVHGYCTPTPKAILFPAAL